MHSLGHLNLGILDGTCEVAVLDRVLHADVTRVVLAIDVRGAAGLPNVGEFLHGNLLSARCGNEHVPNGVGRLAELRFEPDHQVESPLTLDDLRRGSSSYCCDDEAVDVVDVETIAGNFGAVHGHGQAGLAELADDGDLGDSAHLLDDCFDRVSLLFEHLEVGAEDLHGQCALQTGLGLVHGVLGWLCEVEDDTRESLQLLFDRVGQCCFVLVVPVPLVVRLQPNEELVVVEACRVGPVVGPPQLVGDHGHLRE